MVLLIPNIVEYVGVTRTLRVRNLTLDGELVTDQTAGVTVTYALATEDGSDLGSGALAYVAGSDATWETDVNVPDRPGELVDVTISADRGSSHGEWRGTILVTG